jgi:Peptidase A4 family
MTPFSAARGALIAVAALAVAALAVASSVALHSSDGRPADGAVGKQAGNPRRSWAGYPDMPVRLPGWLSESAHPARAAPAIANIGSVGSLNWSGYAINRPGVTFRSVTATFFVPYLNCAKSPGQTMSSEWAGFDGYVGHPQSVEQVGIGADCSATGKASYFAWYEMFPEAQVKASASILAGDSVTVQVSFNPGTGRFRLALTDNTRGEHFERYRRCPAIKISGTKLACLRNSAEVIAEAPATTAGQHVVIDHLSDFGAISFASVSVVDAAGKRGGIVSPLWATTKITQLRSANGSIIAQPTSIAQDMFDTYWLRED